MATTKKKKKITVQASNRKITYDVKENGRADTWRPEKIDDSIVKLLKEAFEIDCTVEEACAFAGISKVSFYAKCKKDAKFLNEMRAAQLYPFYKAKKVLFNSMESKKEDIAQKWATEYLKRREPRYKDKVENTVDMDLDANIDEKVDLKSESMIQLEERRKSLLGFK